MTNEELCVMVQSNDNRIDALDLLYAQNYRMIEKIVRRYNGVAELDDLRQESYFGIVKAAELWNPDKGCNFLSYAVYWIKSVIGRYIEDCGSTVRIPVNRRAMMGRYNRALNSYRVRFGSNPSDIELRALLDLTQEQLERLKADIQAARIRSTSETISSENEDLTLEDTLIDEADHIENVIEKIQHEQLSQTLWSCVDELKPQQSEVIRGHFKNGQTLKECGAALGVSTERARQLEQRAIRELRKGRFAKRLRPYLTEHAAYSMGLSGTGLSAFDSFGSAQERIMCRMEEATGMSLWSGRELTI